MPQKAFQTRLFLLISALLASCLWPADVMAGRLSIGGGGMSVSMGAGDFDGIHLLKRYDDDSNAYHYIDLPEPVPNSLGYALRLDYTRGLWGAEIQYCSSTHVQNLSSLFTQASGTMTYSFLDFNGKLILPLQWVELYLLAGGHYSTLNVEQGEYYSDQELLYQVDRSAGGQMADAFFTGFGYQVGLGICYPFMPFMDVFAEYVFRATGFSIVNDLEITDTMQTGPIHSLFFGVSFNLPVAVW